MWVWVWVCVCALGVFYSLFKLLHCSKSWLRSDLPGERERRRRREEKMSRNRKQEDGTLVQMNEGAGGVWRKDPSQARGEYEDRGSEYEQANIFFFHQILNMLQMNN